MASDFNSDFQSQEFRDRLSNNPESREIVQRVKKYYDGEVDDTVTEKEVDLCWKEFERRKFKKYRLTIGIASSIAAAVVVFFISINIFNNGTKLELQNIMVAVDKVVEKKSEEIILSTTNGEKQIITQTEPLDLTVDVASLNYDTHTLSIPKGRSLVVKLSDGTVVHLNSLTEFTYPTNFSSSDTRRVTLKGEAYFEVAHDSKKQFIVDVEGVNVKVYGTKFNINTNKTGLIETVLVEGSVAVNETMLTPNHKLIYKKVTSDVSIAKVNVDNYISWIDGIYRFYRQPLLEIMNSLAIWYDIEVIYDDSDVKKLEFICNIPRYNNIKEVLDVLKQSGKIDYHIEVNKVYIKSVN